MIRNGSAVLWKPGVGALIDRSHPAAQGLQAYWLFHENTGKILYDIAGTYHFALTGGVARVAEPNGAAVKFDGISGAGLAAGHPLSGAVELTVILRLRQKNGLTNPFGPYLGSEQGFYSGVNINDNAGYIDFYIATLNLPVTVIDDVWGHYAFQWSNAAGIQRTYTNGLQSGNSTGHTVGPLPHYLNTYIGKASAAQGSYVQDSQFSSMKVYSRFLSAAEIAADYEAPYAMFFPPTVRRFYSVPGGVIGSGSNQGGLSIGAGRLSIEV